MAQPSSKTVYGYSWQDYIGPQEDRLIEYSDQYTPNTAQPGTVYQTTFSYDVYDGLTKATISDGTPRTISYVESFEGQIRSSVNSKGPQSRYHFFDGEQQAEISNDGTDNITFTQSIARQTTKPGTGFYVNGSTSPTNTASFGTQYENINGLGGETAGAARSYAVQAGDTLQSIAQAVWGDASFWYLIADANGLTSASMLEAGQVLLIPNKVANAHDNASTFTVYDPNKAIGDTSPTHPPRPHHHGCGVFGQILLAVVAVVVTALTLNPLVEALGPVLGGATAGAAGSIVSQGVGLATGIQSKFNFAAVGEAAIAGGVNAGLATPGVFGDASVFEDLGIAGSSFGKLFAQGALSNALTQGIAVATGLQSKFDFAGVAAAGVSNAVLGKVAGAIGVDAKGNTGFENTVLRGVAGAAGLIANAATRSLINGSDFGDNILRGLPDVIGQTIGNAIAGGIQGSGQMSPAEYQSRMDQYNAALDSGATSDQLGALYHNLGLDGVTVGTAPISYVVSAALPPIEIGSPAPPSSGAVAAATQPSAQSVSSPTATVGPITVHSLPGGDPILVANELSALPANVLNLLASRGVNFLAVQDSVTDYDQSLRGVIPRGWAGVLDANGNQLTWDSVPGEYDPSANTVYPSARGRGYW